MPDTEKEDTLERRRLQNRMAQRRFRERHSKKKTSGGTIHKPKDAQSQAFEVLETTTTQPSFFEDHPSWAPLETIPHPSAQVFSSHIDGDLNCDLFGDEHLLHEMDLAGFGFPTPVDINETNQLSIMADKGHDSHVPSPSAALEPGQIPTPLTSQPEIGTRSRHSASNSVVELWPCSPGSSTSLPMFTNTNDSSTSNHCNSESWHGPLHIAARNGNNRITQLLVQHVMDCNEKDSDGRTPLMLAVIGGHEDVVSTLLSHGGRVADADAELRTALHLAVLHRRADLLQTILAECSGKSGIVNAYDASGMTPLHMAIDLDFAPGVQALLKVGADVGSKARRK